MEMAEDQKTPEVGDKKTGLKNSGVYGQAHGQPHPRIREINRELRHPTAGMCPIAENSEPYGLD